MPTIVNAAEPTEMIQRLVIWVLFFATSVYGHVALKLAVGPGTLGYRESLKVAATSFWGWSTVIAWGLSCVLWLLAISRQKLLVASSVSSLSYVLICAAAWLWLGERVTTTQGVGIALIAAGIVLIK